jgi:hypothetical protein
MLLKEKARLREIEAGPPSMQRESWLALSWFLFVIRRKESKGDWRHSEETSASPCDSWVVSTIQPGQIHLFTAAVSWRRSG